MDKYEKMLLLKGLEHYNKTGELKFRYLIANSDELAYCTSAGQRLIKAGLIDPISKNFNLTVYRVPEDCVLEYRLTCDGIEQAEQLKN